MNRTLGLLFFALVGIPNLAHADEPPPSPSWLPSVTRPCSLRKVQAELSRRYDAGVSIDAVLLDLRVVWSFAEVRTLDETLTRLAELTLPHPEARGRRAADEEEQGKLNPAGYPSGIRRYLASRAPDFRLLRRLTVQQMNGLLAGETIGIAAATVPQQSLRDMVDRAYPVADPEGPPEVMERRREGSLESITKHGLTLRIEEGFAGTQACLSLGFGRAGMGPLCLIGDEELGLPFIHVNPYRWLEQDGPVENAAPLSEWLRRPLSADVTAPPRFEDALLALAHVAQTDVISDAYLARTASLIMRIPFVATKAGFEADEFALICGFAGGPERDRALSQPPARVRGGAGG